MIIHSVKADGFRIFGEPVYLEFPDTGKIGIVGQNESGKTTLLQLIEYGLYGLAGKGSSVKDRSELISWRRDEAKIELEFTCGANRYKIRRFFSEKRHRVRLESESGKHEAITTVDEANAFIEQITGIDRDSFAKLVYIRQKDLDALRLLARGQREQLINKVMGIEIFDDARAKVKVDAKDFERTLEKDKIRLDEVCDDKERYVDQLSDFQQLEQDITDLEGQISEKKQELGEAEANLKGYEWKQKRFSASVEVSSKKDLLNTTRASLNELAHLNRDISCYAKALNHYEVEVANLFNWKERFERIGSRFQEAQQDYASTRAKVTALKEGSSAQYTQTSEQMSVVKRQYMSRFVKLLVVGILLLVGAVLVPLLLFVSVPLLIGAFYTFYRYLQVDKEFSSRSTATASIAATDEQLNDKKIKLDNVTAEMNSLQSATSYNSAEEINARLTLVLAALKRDTGAESIESTKALLKSKKNRKDGFNEIEFKEKEQNLTRLIDEKTNELDELDKQRPDLIDEGPYNARDHESTKQYAKDVRETYDELIREKSKKQGRKEQIESDLSRLKEAFDTYPTLAAAYAEKEEHNDILQRVHRELAETSKYLRGQVIPHAELVINQILPSLTDGRYSNFEITEELTFKVYSDEAGSYKGRDIFSGGTQDQFLIALRLAFTKSILSSRVTDDVYALFMDECISSSDGARKHGIFEVLDRMKDVFSQVIIIAHEDVSQCVDYQVVLGRTDRGYARIESKSW